VLASDPAVADMLIDAAGRRARSLACRHVEYRHTGHRFLRLAPKFHKVAMVLPLPSAADALWSALDRKVRNQVRKAEKSGLVAEVGNAALLREFYKVFAHNMRDLGTPVYSRRLFEAVLALFPDRARVTVVRQGSRAVAGAIAWRWRDRVEVPWASSLREFNALAPNNLLYWTILQQAIADGATQLDFGRSTPDEGTFHFKKQWGAAPHALCWEYDVLDGGLPDQSPKNPKFGLAIRAWQRLPLAVANALGPHIVRAIP
jgi:serine/alanine adding enzyme